MRLLREHESSLLAAKVLSVSRLLLQTLSQTSSLVPVLDTLRSQLASLRRHLLRRLDHRLSSLDTSHEGLVEAICAFCLATSSSSSDALRHYHHLRLQGIRRVVELEESEHHSVIQALQYFTKSLQTTKALLRRSLSEALKSLGTRPILRDPAVHALEQLDLKTLQRWMAVEIQDFVPFIKHNDLVGPDIPSPLLGWSKEAFEIFSQALKNRVEEVQGTTDLLSLRRALLETWLPVSVSTPVHSGPEILRTLRDVLNKRVVGLISTEASGLTKIGNRIADVMNEDPVVTKADLSIWDKTFVTMPAGKGASAFKKQLQMRHLSIVETISQILRSLDAWIVKVRANGAVIEQLRKIRWEDHIEDDEDDEDSVAKVESLLQNEDPKLYEAEQALSVARAFSNFQLKISDTAKAISQRTQHGQVQSLLRIMREASQRICLAFPEADLTMFDEIVPSLHNELATDVATKLLTLTESGAAWQSLSSTASSHVWEGVPPLPVQPSPRTFRLLHKLQEVMGELGGDLWTQPAVSALKKAVSQRMVEHDLFSLDAGNRHGKNPNGLNNGMLMMNGDTAKPPSSARSSRIQDLFDVFYLNYALALKQGDDVTELAATVERLSTLSELEASDAKAVRRRAKDYWARTNLLFGLLG